MSAITLEICIDTPAGLEAAIAGGADRIELCSALALGGLSPSAGMIELAAQAPVPVMAMIRPRAGDFCWSPAEVAVMRAEIAACARARLQGVVIGATQRDGRLDGAVLAQLAEAAAGLDITMHRAIDLCPDQSLAEDLDLLGRLGIRRVLSSGGALRAPDGLARLAQMARLAPGISIMPGSGVTPASVPDILAALPGLREIHASCMAESAQSPGDEQLIAFGFAPADGRQTSAPAVAALRRALDAQARP